jgi:aldehyde dehydrogenase (NAD+)
MTAYLNFIGGESCQAFSGETLEVIDPSDGMPFATIPRSGAEDVAQAV